MKKHLIFSASLIFSISMAFTQNKSEINELIKLAFNDIEAKWKVIPLEIRPNEDSVCNAYFSRVGLAVITTPTVARYDEDGKRYNEKVKRYMSRIHVTYNCDFYHIKLYDEPVILEKDELENLNENDPTMEATIIIAGDNYKIMGVDNTELNSITRDRIKTIGDEVMKPAEKLFSKTMDD